MSDVLRCPVCSCAHSFVHIAHETAGAARIRHSLRPLTIEGEEFPANLGRIASREREGVSIFLRHSGRAKPSYDAQLRLKSIARQSWWINRFRACAEWRIYDARLRIVE